jgi:hypothetical protein
MYRYRRHRGMPPGLVAMWLVLGVAYLAAVFLVGGHSVVKVAQCMG